MTDWREAARTLVGDLERAGVLGDGWRAAFAETPRHLFVPSFRTADGERRVGDEPAGLAAVYADRSLTTRDMLAPGTELRWPTSSSTRPSLMARMLGLLDARPGQRVLEIGTGTGYNAAILGHRLGAGAVTSIDIDPELVRTARDRLASLGQRPHLVTGDGAAGVPERAPYDRILATCGVSAVPAAWVRQLAPGGRIVVDLRGELASTLVALDRTGPHEARGRLLATPGDFMWLRARADNPLRLGGRFEDRYDFTAFRTARSDVPLTAFTDPDFLVLLQLAVPGLGPVGRVEPAGGVFLVGDGDPSWLEIDPGGGVRFGGPRPLWPAVAGTWRRFDRWGRPARDRLGVTADGDGRQQIWLDRPDAVVLDSGQASSKSA